MDDNKDTLLEEHKEHVRRNRMASSRLWMICSAVLLVLLVAVVALNGLPTVSSKNAVADDTISYVNSELLNGYATAELNSVETQGDLYKLDVTITATSGTAQNAILYVTKDGQYMFPTAIDMTDTSTNDTTGTPDTTADAVYEIDTTGEPFFGKEDAKVTIVELSDFQCPYCEKGYTTMNQLMEKYPDDVKVVFINYPLSFHEYAQKAAEASECAFAQDKFEEYYSTLFENQDALTVDDLKQYAVDVGLDTEAFNTCLDDGEMVAEVEEDMAKGDAVASKLSSFGTPAFFINGKALIGARPLTDFESAVDAALAA